ncbi:hypothetical protein [Anaeromicrobium sediminis]|uniref:Deacetylase PdaC domain-containing protein n=1 Tax=Anaeromicrobium sediminis TaxID=1478221 RepID=A0A267MN93_9FIRM|nr:hypothetical protein [Anaeromicrobium sediminis]PAB61064.1 hypothetical protein CCE28_01145 [Anaeromicrobium sediminis]
MRKKEIKGSYAMDFMKISISILLIMVLSLTACGLKEGPIDKEEEDMALNYEIEKKELSLEKNIKLYYPELKSTSTEMKFDKVNEDFKNAIEPYSNKEVYSHVNIDYEVTKKNNKVISVLYDGKGKMINIGEIKIKTSVTFDLEANEEITSYNVFKKDEESQKKVKDIINEKAKAQNIDNVEAEGMNLYLRDNYIILFYMPLSDTAKEFVEIKIEINEIKDYIDPKFKEKI